MPGAAACGVAVGHSAISPGQHLYLAFIEPRWTPATQEGPWTQTLAVLGSPWAAHRRGRLVAAGSMLMQLCFKALNVSNRGPHRR